MNLQHLRQKIHAIEWQERKSPETFSFGVSSIDDMLPCGGLASGSLHEWIGITKGAVLGVCASILARIAQTQGPILWCSQNVNLYLPGLQTFGLLPEHLIFVHVQNNKEALWVLEEGLGSSKLGAVVGENISINFTASRRLQLNASKNGVTAFLLQEAQSILNTTSSAITRWQISPLPSSMAPGLFHDNGIGKPRFDVELLRCKGGKAPLKWGLEWDESSLCFNLLSSAKQFEEAQSHLPVVQMLHAFNRTG